MPIKRLDPLSALIAGALVLIVLLSGYLTLALLKVKRLTDVEKVLFASTQVVEVSKDTIVTSDTTIKVTKSTKFQAPASIVPYAQKNNQGRKISRPELGINDLHPGDFISVTVKGSTTNISLLSTTTAFNGPVISIKGNTLTVKSLLPATINTLYTVNTLSSTEFTTPQGTQPTVIPLSRIKVGDLVTAYTNEDITRTTEVTALKLDLIPPSL